jgi:hypothetical protein
VLLAVLLSAWHPNISPSRFIGANCRRRLKTRRRARLGPGALLLTVRDCAWPEHCGGSLAVEALGRAGATETKQPALPSVWALDKPHPTRRFSFVQAATPATQVMAGYI